MAKHINFSLFRSARQPALILLSLMLASLASASVHAQAANEDEQAQDAVSDSTEVSISDVVISASRIPVPSNQVGSSYTVIDERDIEDRAPIFVYELLREVPGFAVSQTGAFGGNTTVRIRGSESNHTLIRLDGVELGDPKSGGVFELQHLPVSSIDRIEILRGPQSSIYGSDAVGGVINITTPTPAFGTESSASIEFGSKDTTKTDVYFGAASEQHFLALSVGHVETDGFTLKADNDEPDSFENMFVNTKFGMNVAENVNLTAVAVNINTDSDYDGCGFPSSNDCVGEDKKTLLGASLSIDQLDGRVNHEINLARTSHKRDDFMDGNPNGESKGSKESAEYQGVISWDQFESDQSTVVAIENEKLESESSSYSPNGKLSYRNYTLEHRAGFQDRYFFSVSARRDDNRENRFVSKTTYRGTAAVILNNSAKVHASYGTGVKNPTISEVFGWTGSWAPNPDLLPESSKSWDIGVEYHIDQNGTTLSATYFDNRIEDLIDIYSCYEFCDDSDWNNDIYRAVNKPGESEITGMELSARTSLESGLEISASATLTRGFDSEGNELVRRPHKLIQLNISRDFHLLQRDINVNLNIQHTGSQRDVVWPGHVDLDSYTLADLNGSLQLSPNTKIFARVSNLFDNTDYVEVTGYSVKPRTYFIGVKHEF